MPYDRIAQCRHCGALLNVKAEPEEPLVATLRVSCPVCYERFPLAEPCPSSAPLVLVLEPGPEASD